MEDNGRTLREIIKNYGNKNYDVIQFRTIEIEKNGSRADYINGYGKYVDGELETNNGYSLNHEFTNCAEAKYDNDLWLIVWEELPIE